MPGWSRSHPASPPDLLDRLATDADETVRGWVAANPASSPDLLERLCDDSSPTVRSVAAWAQCW